MFNRNKKQAEPKKKHDLSQVNEETMFLRIYYCTLDGGWLIGQYYPANTGSIASFRMHHKSLRHFLPLPFVTFYICLRSRTLLDGDWNRWITN